MSKCELFFTRGDENFEILNENINLISSSLYSQGIEVKYQTDISSDKEKIKNAINKSLNGDDNLDCFVFTNILTSIDSSSFKDYFYDFIMEYENEINKDNKSDERKRVKISSLGNLGNGYKGYCFKLKGASFIVLPKASLCSTDNASLINEGVSSALSVLKNEREKYPDGLISVKEKKNKESFIQRTFPHKGDDGKTIIRKIIILVAFVAILVALGYLLDYFVIAPYMNNQINSELQEIAYNKDDNGNKKTKQEQNWKALKKVNKEIVGWISSPKTPIDYPVLEHKGDTPDDQYYLYRNYKKEYSEYGIPFIDYRSTKSVDSKNVIIHGHNMNDGSMFSSLSKYGDLTGDLDYYKKHPVITFNTPKADAKWKIISVFKTSTLYEHGEFFNYMQGEFTSDAEFMNFVYNVRKRSLFDIPVMVNEDDQILTLSTCSYEFSNWRTVVVARKVRPGESAKVDVKLSKRNKSPLFPEVYYEANGGTRPDIKTFSVALKNNKITWYDGKGNLKGSEILTGTVAANPTEPTEAPGATKNKSNTPQPNNQTVTFYTVNYLNYDGSIYESFSVREGDPLPYPSNNPTCPSDDYYNYKFDHWQLDIPGFDPSHVKFGVDIAPYFNAEDK